MLLKEKKIFYMLLFNILLTDHTSK